MAIEKSNKIKRILDQARSINDDRQVIKNESIINTITPQPITKQPDHIQSHNYQTNQVYTKNTQMENPFNPFENINDILSKHEFNRSFEKDNNQMNIDNLNPTDFKELSKSINISPVLNTQDNNITNNSKERNSIDKVKQEDVQKDFKLIIDDDFNFIQSEGQNVEETKTEEDNKFNPGFNDDEWDNF